VDHRYLALNPTQIVATIEKLHGRIGERFPGSGLQAACTEFLHVARQTEGRAARILRRNPYLRAAAVVLAGVILAGVVGAFAVVDFSAQGVNFFEFVQTLESAINDVVLIGAGIFFLFSVELRLRRKATLEALHELRSLAHVIDMHQLSKDPEYLLRRGAPTTLGKHAPTTAFLLGRYLDYCSEMLSLIGKVAALYVQDFDDQVAVTAVNEVETLATGLSRKIWQKIMIIDQLDPNARADAESLDDRRANDPI